MMEILKAVTSQLKANPKPPTNDEAEKVKLASGEEAKVLEDDGDIEILEVVDTPPESQVVAPAKKKLRPNDRVSVRYADGRVENNIKYKKVKADVESGAAEVVG